jgi:catabolite repression HPr-like protein
MVYVVNEMEEVMITKDMTIEISTGLEARLVAVFVQVASQFESSIYVQHDNKRVNAKSIMGMMTLGLPVGENITVSAEGTDEEEAIKEIGKYLSNTK